MSNISLTSLSDMDSTNVWSLDMFEVPKLWDMEKEDPLFTHFEDKYLNIIRLAFEVVHYNPADPREKKVYENGEWAIFQHADESKGWVAIRKKMIQKLNDLSYENIRHLTASAILELINRNFGGGWESVPTKIKDIILSAFDISNTQLPASRIHKPGGTVEKKQNQGYEVLEIEKGTWVEAIFCKKKEPIVKIRLVNDEEYDENGNKIKRHANGKHKRKKGELYEEDDEELEDSIDEEDELDDELDEDIEEDELDDELADDDDELDEESYYSNYTPGADIDVDPEELDGFSIEEDM